jgi:hypothetical protein
MGLSDEWIRKVEIANPNRHQLFMIRRVETDSLASKTLRDLDLILAVNGRVVTRTYELDVKDGAKELELVCRIVSHLLHVSNMTMSDNFERKSRNDCQSRDNTD